MSNVEIMKKYSEVYRTSDEIKNFKISIELRKNVERLPLNEETSFARVFEWQEKLYGKFEREFYGDEKNCVTELQKKYHDDIVRMNQVNDIFFTYTDDDDHDFFDEASVVNSRQVSKLPNKVKNFRMENGEEISESSKEYDFQKNLGNSLNNPYPCKFKYKTMRIMADLEQYGLNSEHTLCTIRYNKERNILFIYPNFTTSEPCFLATSGDSTDMFYYFIQDASEKMPVDSMLKENEIMNKIIAHQLKLQSQKIGTDFELPSRNTLTVHLFIEILTAKNFEYNDIYVQYFVDLPETWTCKDSNSLKGTTQTCHSSGGANIANFGYPFEFVLEYNLAQLRTTSVPKAPYIYFEVTSKDSWNRHRTEGLTYKILPIGQPGTYKYNLKCLRLVPKGFTGNLRRFFIGDFSNYNDITWTAVPKDHEDKIINKYGVDTVGTGDIEVRMNVVHQSQAFLENFHDSDLVGPEKLIVEKLKMSSLVKSVEEVLRAFKMAKRRMIDARKHV